MKSRGNKHLKNVNHRKLTSLTWSFSLNTRWPWWVTYVVPGMHLQKETNLFKEISLPQPLHPWICALCMPAALVSTTLKDMKSISAWILVKGIKPFSRRNYALLFVSGKREPQLRELWELILIWGWKNGMVCQNWTTGTHKIMTNFD